MINLQKVVSANDTKKLIAAVEKNLVWFQKSGVMRPDDGSWGVGERICTRDGKALGTILDYFGAYTEYDGYYVIEPRRADCNFQTMLLFLYAGLVCGNEQYKRVGENILDYLYCRSGLLNRNKALLPQGGWNWSSTARSNSIWFDDNAWCIIIQLMLGKLAPKTAEHFDSSNWALLLAEKIHEGLQRSLELPDEKGEWHDPEKEWIGRVELPHWGSLAIFALSAANTVGEHPEFRKTIERYHIHLKKTIDRLPASECAYALMGAVAAFCSFNDPAAYELAEQCGFLLLEKADPMTGNLPSEHYETPAGKELVDLIYTLNWSFPALQMLCEINEADCFKKLKQLQCKLLLEIQDQSDDSAFYGCWRGMYDLKSGIWGGGDLYEGGSGSIYTGWTNAPISIAMLLEADSMSLWDLIENGLHQQQNKKSKERSC